MIASSLRNPLSLKIYQNIRYVNAISKFGQHFEDRELQSLSPDEILSFLTQLTEGNKQLTKHTRYSNLSSFFNFIKNNNDPFFQNPCDNQMIRKLFKITEIPQCKCYGVRQR